jgi:spore coat polysaccharide biosynthesis protein SpsF
MTPRNTVAIIQGRMASSRLPGKILLDIAGKPMLAHVVERARRARTVDQVVVATTTQPEDDAVEAYCRQAGIDCSRGSLQDVLDRFYQAALAFKADTIVRLTADCPLLDPQVLDLTVNEFFRTGVDFGCNRLPPPLKRTYPIGLDVEVCTFQALERAWKEAKKPNEREHVMPYLYDPPGRFKVLRIDYEKDYSEMRWTVDTPEDLDLVRQIFGRLTEHPDFTWLDVLALFEREPELARINAQVKHRTYLDVDERQKPAGQ